MRSHDSVVDSLENRLKENSKYVFVGKEIPTYKTFKRVHKIGQQDLITIHFSSSNQIYVTSWEVKTNYRYASAYKRARWQAHNFYTAMKKFPYVKPRFVVYHTKTGYHRIKPEEC